MLPDRDRYALDLFHYSIAPASSQTLRKAKVIIVVDKVVMPCYNSSSLKAICDTEACSVGASGHARRVESVVP
jgi:hypothetical protein